MSGRKHNCKHGNRPKVIFTPHLIEINIFNGCHDYHCTCHKQDEPCECKEEKEKE